MSLIECCITGDEDQPLLQSNNNNNTMPTLVKCGILNIEITLLYYFKRWQQRFVALYSDGRLKHWANQVDFSNNKTGLTYQTIGSACVNVSYPKVPMKYSSMGCAYEIVTPMDRFFIHHYDSSIATSWKNCIEEVANNQQFHTNPQNQSFPSLLDHQEFSVSSIGVESLLTQDDEYHSKRSEHEIERLLTFKD